MKFGLLIPPGTRFPLITPILSPRPHDLASTIERFGRDIIPRFATERA